MINLALSPAQVAALTRWHKWIGITVFLRRRRDWLARGASRRRRRSRCPPGSAARAAATHAALYVLMFAIPLSGWIYSSATGVSVVYLGLVPLPDLVAKDKALAAVLGAVHGTLNFTLLALVIVHAGAALRHDFVDRDGVLARMLPGSCDEIRCQGSPR